MAKKDKNLSNMDMHEKLAAIADMLNKGEFGGINKDAVQVIGNIESMNIERFSSGSRSLDWAMGGGYPMGRITEIFGPESGGKCLTADTYVMGQHGLMTIAEVFSQNGFVASCISKTVEHAYPVLDENGDLENTSHFWWNNRQWGVRLTTRAGLEIKGTLHHPIRVVDEIGFVKWRQLSEIKSGDSVVVSTGAMVDPPDNGLDRDDAVLLAMVIAEGSLGDERCISFSNSNEALVDEFKMLVHRKFGFDNFKTYDRDETDCVSINCNSIDLFRQFCDKYGVEKCLSGDKLIPRCIRTAALEVQCEFLRMYMLCGGSVDSERNRIEISSKSKELLRQIQLMVMNFGAFGSLFKKSVDDQDDWCLTFDGEDAVACRAQVFGSTLCPQKVLPDGIGTHTRGIPGFSLMAKMLIDDCANLDRNLGYILVDCANGVCSLTRERFEKLAALRDRYEFGPAALSILAYLEKWFENGWRSDEVVSTEILDLVPTFDFTKPSHTFWSNGFVSHNTSLCYHAISEFQKKYPHDPVAFVDVEYCLAKGSQVYVPDERRYVRVEKLVGGEFGVASLANDGSLRKQRAIARFSGIHQVLSIECSGGRRLLVTAAHRVLVHGRGYVRADEVVVGDNLCAPFDLSVLEDDSKHLEFNRKDGNLVFAKVHSVMVCKETETYDVSVCNPCFNEQNFLVSGLFVHNSFDFNYAEKLGVNTDIILFHQPESGEQALNLIKQMVNNGVKLVVCDSVASLTPLEEQENIGGGSLGSLARLMSKAMRQLAADAGRAHACLIFTNQVRDKIGIAYGNPETTPGGRALKFYSSIRVNVRRAGTEKVGEKGKEEAVGNRVKAYIEKNKVASPGRIAYFFITYGIGIDEVAETFDIGVEKGIISKGGSWFSLGEERLGQGRANVIDSLRQNQHLLEKINLLIDGQNLEPEPDSVSKTTSDENNDDEPDTEEEVTVADA